MSQVLEKFFPEYLPFVGPDGCIEVEILKAFYDLQEAPARWNEHIHKSLIEIGAVQSKNDDCLYMMKKGMLDDFDCEFKKKCPEHSTRTGDELEYQGMKISYDRTTKKTSISQVAKIPSTLPLFEESELEKDKERSKNYTEGNKDIIGGFGGTTLAISRKQKVLARSSTEAELIAIEELLQYAIFARELVSDLTDNQIKYYAYQEEVFCDKRVF
eukprot:gene18637-24377_t